MIPAKLGTAITVAFGPVLAADGTASTGALTYLDFKIWKNGTVGALDPDAAATHKFEGVYELVLIAADISAVGTATITLNKSPLSASRVVITVLPVAVYELLMTLTQTSAGLLTAGFKKVFDIASPVFTAASVNQTIDNPTAAAIGSDAAGKVLVTPAQKLVTDASGFVTFANTSIATVTTLTNAPPAPADMAKDSTVAKEAGGNLAAVKTVVDLNLDAKVSTIQAAIVAATTIDRAADSVTQTTGTVISGTVINTHTKNSSYYVTAPVTPAVGGFGLNHYLEFMLSDAEIAAEVHVWARFENGGSPKDRVVRMSAYDWVGTAWEFISTGATDLAESASDEERLLELLVRHRSETGIVRIRFTSDSTDTSDRLYIDQCTVHVSMSGPTKSEIAIAVAERVLATPANKLATDGAGAVTANNAELAAIKVVTDKLGSAAMLEVVS